MTRREEVNISATCTHFMNNFQHTRKHSCFYMQFVVLILEEISNLLNVKSVPLTKIRFWRSTVLWEFFFWKSYIKFRQKAKTLNGCFFKKTVICAITHGCFLFATAFNFSHPWQQTNIFYRSTFSAWIQLPKKKKYKDKKQNRQWLEYCLGGQWTS